MFVKFVSSSPRKGRSFIALPSNLRNCQSLINIRNTVDENCFFFCFTAAYHLHTDEPLIQTSSWQCKRSSDTYNPSINQLAKKHLGEFATPMPFNQIDRFEKLNEVQVNVFRFEEKDLVPLRVSKYDRDFVRDLLLLSEGRTHHYVLITDLKHFPNFVKNKQSRSRDEKCKNCFHVCSSLESLKNHKVNCYENEAARIVLPDERKKLHQFKSTRATWFVPLAVYFDTERFLVPMHVLPHQMPVDR